MVSATRELWYKQILIIIITYVAYSGLNACRKGFAYAKDSMHQDWGMDEYWQGVFDGTLMFSYAIGLYISGRIGDKFNPSFCLGWGLFFTGFLNVFFSLSYPYFDMNISDNSIYYLLIWILNGLSQSIAWPTSIKIIGSWIKYPISIYNKSGLIFGIWASCQSFGNILGSIFVTITISNDYDIQYSFFMTGFFTMFFSVFIICGMPAKPDINLINLAKEEQQSNENDNKQPQNELIQLNKAQSYDTDPSPDDNKDDDDVEFELSYFNILLLPNVIVYATSFACLKSLNYTLFFWLPLHLDDILNHDDVAGDTIAMTFDIGQIIGGISIGLLTDKLTKRSPVLFLSMICATIPIFLFTIEDLSSTALTILCILTGLFIGGPYNLIPSAIAADLSNIQQLKGNKSAISTIAGFINGTGSFAAAILQFFVPVILGGKHTHEAWRDLYIFLGFISLIGSLVLLKLVIKDITYLKSYPIHLKKTMSSFRKYSTFRLFPQQ